MADPIDPSARLALLEADNARLRRLLDQAGATEDLRHGLRDTLATLRAIMRQSAETAEHVEYVESYVAHLEGRFDAIMQAQATTDAFGEADLHSIVSNALLTHLVREGEQATIAGPDMRLAPKAAQAFALAMHELASNAVEHGRLGLPDGRVNVAWRIASDEEGTANETAPTVVFDWKETGGVALTAPSRRGFGTTVLDETLAYALKARTGVVFEPNGLRCSIRFPLLSKIGRLVPATGMRNGDLS